MVTIKDILYDAKALLRRLEEIDEDGVAYFHLEEAKRLHNSVYDYEHPKSDTGK